MKSIRLLSMLIALLHLDMRAQSGSLDTTFSEDGYAVSTIGPSTFDLPYGSAIQPDGKILMAGASNSGINGDFTVLRYRVDGELDTGFGEDGIVQVDYNGFSDRGHAIAIQPDGKIIVAGETQVNNQPDFAILRLHPDGTVDSSFGTNGWTTTDLGTDYEFPNCVAIQSDLRIVAAGKIADGFNSNIGMVRYHPGGQLDTTFGENGIVTTNLRDEDEAFAILIDAQQRIILGGFASVLASGDFALVRYNPDGTPDKFFGDGGKVLTDLEGANASDYIRSLALLPDGKILAAGNANNNNLELTSDVGLARYDQDGQLDASFGVGGISIISFGSSTDVNGLAVQPDGKILVGGNSDLLLNNTWLVARFHPQGALDIGFGNMGITTVDLPGTKEFTTGLFVQSDSRIIQTGSSGTQTDNDFAIARFIADFTMSYSVSGIVCYGQPEGSILVDVTGGIPPYGYSIDGGASFQSSNIFTDLPAGTYSVLIRDSNGPGTISSIGPITIKDAAEPPAVDVEAESDSDQIIVHVSGNSTGLAYSIDGGITFQADSIFPGLADGVYAVVVQDANGCVIHTEQVMISTLATGSLQNAYSFTLSPNPSDGWVNLLLPEASVGNVNVQVIDMKGKVIFTTQTAQSTNRDLRIDLSHLSNGIYIVKIQDGSTFGTRKLVRISE